MTQKQYNRLKKALMMTVISTAILFLIIGYALGCAVKCYNATSSSVIGYETVTVSSGDKLWTICSEYCPENIDIRHYINSTMNLNGLDSADIYPGDKIRLAVYE